MKILIAIICTLLSWSCEAGIPVLMYHQITDDKPLGDTVISPKNFSAQMKYLSDNHYTTLSIAELIEIMSQKLPMHNRAVVITFDDGFNSVLNAVPILESYEMKATFNVISGYAGAPYLSIDELKELSSNPSFDVESHTMTHPWDPNNNLTTWANGAERDAAMNELIVSKLTLERFGKPVNYIAWPSGYYDETLIEMSKRVGYKGAMTIEEGINNAGDDPFKIKRLFVSGNCDVEQFAKILVTGNATQCLK